MANNTKVKLCAFAVIVSFPVRKKNTNQEKFLFAGHSLLDTFLFMNSELLYQLALTLIPNIGDVQAKLLLQVYGNASSIFRAPLKELETIEGIGTVRARSIKSFTDFSAAQEEMKWIEKFRIRPVFFTDDAYPKRLLNCYDAPPLLFYKGEASLNVSRAVAVVGTRNHTEYGRSFTEYLVKDLADHDVLVISGLAYGIDALAHKSALKSGLKTVAVVGHGLDTTYPSHHCGLVQDILQHDGGILTEFFTHTKPDKHNFPLRNRIVAGLSDATIVIETDVKGGSMITAKLADAYNRDVFALPGRTIDKKSSGCNYLIRHNKAIMITEAEDVLNVMGWKEQKTAVRRQQRQLFLDFTAEESSIVQLLQEKNSVHIDEINLRSGLSSSTAAATLLNLELQGIVATLPGKLYQLL